MPTINVSAIEEGDAFSAASLNSRFTEIEDGLNDLVEDAIEPHALRSDHLPSMIPYAAFNMVNGPYASLAGTSPKNCTSAYPTWELVQNGAGTANLECTFDAMTLVNNPTEAAQIGGVLVLVNVHVTNIYKNAVPSWVATWCPGIRIETRSAGGGLWTPLQHTERWDSGISSTNATSSGSRHFSDLAIRTLITAENVAGAISGVRVRMSALDVSSGTWTSPYFEIGEANMTVLPLYGRREV